MILEPARRKDLLRYQTLFYRFDLMGMQQKLHPGSTIQNRIGLIGDTN